MQARFLGMLIPAVLLLSACESLEGMKLQSPVMFQGLTFRNPFIFKEEGKTPNATASALPTVSHVPPARPSVSPPAPETSVPAYAPSRAGSPPRPREKPPVPEQFSIAPCISDCYLFRIRFWSDVEKKKPFGTVIIARVHYPGREDGRDIVTGPGQPNRTNPRITSWEERVDPSALRTHQNPQFAAVVYPPSGCHIRSPEPYWSDERHPYYGKHFAITRGNLDGRNEIRASIEAGKREMNFDVIVSCAKSREA